MNNENRRTQEHELLNSLGEAIKRDCYMIRYISHVGHIKDYLQLLIEEMEHIKTRLEDNNQ